MYTITKEEIAALKKSNNIILQFYNGKSVIRIQRDAKKTKDGGTVSYEEIVLPVESTFDVYSRPTDAKDYQRSMSPGQYNIDKCFYMLSSDYGTGKALKTYLKAGDSIRIKWTAAGGNGYTFQLKCNNPGYLNEDLYHDRVYLSIIPRGTSQYENGFDLLLGDTICPNNSARMIKY